MKKILTNCLLAAAFVFNGGGFSFAGHSKKAAAYWTNNVSVPDYRVLAFPSSANTQRYPEFELKSREEYENCVKTSKGVKCGRTEGDLVREKISFEFYAPKDILPWEKNIFKIILKGRDLSVERIAGSHEWNILIMKKGESSLVSAKPLRKVRTDPDEEGIIFRNAEFGKGMLHLFFDDKWSDYYGSGRTEFAVSLFRKRFFILKDKKLGEWFFSEKPSEKYDLFLDEARTGKLAGGKYYIRWSFQRSSAGISNPVWIDKGRSADFTIKKQL